ncbi:MAG TPA: Hsp20/alpha crystallin family protein, partial [Thermoanaerobaculia bacterium]|nr:Hsp20/alpha crystallin family protein [Thermoanaerobaculia bacterium]
MKPLARFYGPLVELSRLQSELNRLFSLFVESNKGASSASSWDPNMDLLDDGENVRVLIERPGVEAEDVEVTIRGRVLTARGTKRGRIRTREGIRFFCMERYFGTFVKSVPLPRPVNTHRARTKVRDGLLEVIFPSVPDQREKELVIPVRSE